MKNYPSHPILHLQVFVSTKYVGWPEVMDDLCGSDRSRKGQFEIVSNCLYGLLMTNNPNSESIETKFYSIYFV